MKSVLFLALISGSLHAKDMKCESAHEFKELVVSANYVAASKKINFPVQGLIYGITIDNT